MKMTHGYVHACCGERPENGHRPDCIKFRAHVIEKQVNDGTNIYITCRCGAHWSMGRGATEERIREIFVSHEAYAKRMETKPD